MRVALFCGGREWSDPAPIARVLDSLDRETWRVVHGAARGADMLADTLARARGFDVVAYPAHWRDRGSSAGHERNARMLRDATPAIVYAFKAGFDHSLRRGGTEHMVRIARAAGVSCVVVEK